MFCGFVFTKKRSAYVAERCRSFGSVPAPCAAAGGRAAAVLDRLHDLETFAEALIVYDLALAQKVQRFDDLAVVRHVHQMLIRRPRLLLGCTLRCATFLGF